MSDLRATVVVPVCDDQRGVDLLLAGLDQQTLPPSEFEVVIADDGSRQSPDPGRRAYAVRVVRQPDLGFRAAAARNLGAAQARGRTLCFLDADIVPSPTYLERMAPTDREPTDTVRVGARRHVDLTGLSSHDVTAWLHGGPAPPRLPDPEWLARGYAQTDDLGRADDASFRFVISAALSLPRDLFARLGGFDESFTEYGGEDWELAQRCWLAGADLRHDPEAVTWHDGPDVAGRPADLAEVKNTETLALAELLTHPLIRGGGVVVYAVPDVAVEVQAAGWSRAQLALVLDWLLDARDVGVWVQGADVERSDPRVHTGAVPHRVLSRCRRRVEVAEPVVGANWRLDDVARQPQEPASGVRWAPTRALSTDAERAWTPVVATAVPADAVIERWRGRAAAEAGLNTPEGEVPPRAR